MNRIGGFAFDLMIGVFLILAVVGGISTCVYLQYVCKKLFPEYK